MGKLPQKSKISKLKLLFITITTLLSTVVKAQPAIELANYKKKYPGESLIILETRRNITIQMKNGDINITIQEYEERMLLDNKANLYNQDAVQYSGFMPLLDISAKTLVPEEKKYKPVEVEIFNTNDVRDGSIFHDDVKEKSFFFPSLTEGAKTVVLYSQQVTEPRFLPGFYFASGIPVEKSSYTITAPAGVELGFSYMNMKPEDANFKTEETKQGIVYSWNWNEIPKIEFEGDAPNIRYYIPHIICYIKSYAKDGKQTKIAGEVSDLHNWYYTFIKDLNSKNDTELNNIVDSLTNGLTNPEEKVKAIYYWVQNNIKYIAFEEGMGGYIPRQAAAVCKKRYGDCKDMANTINEMLNIAGVESHLTWIGTRDIPYTYEHVPLPASDNHMIVTYKAGNEYQFLDATENHLPFGYPSLFIQGKEALINLGKDHFEISRVPEVPAGKNKMKENVFIRLADDEILGTVTTSMTGYYKSRAFYSLSSIKESDWVKELSPYYGMGNNNCLLDTMYAENLYERDNDLNVHYTFRLRDYAIKAGDEVYVNMILNKFFQHDKIKKERELPIEREFKYTIQADVTLEIPENYQVTYIPENTGFKEEPFQFSVNYKKTEKQIVMQYSIVSNTLMIEKQDFETWNRMQDALTNAYNDVVILKKNKNK
jgi:hypothetical protein